MDRNEFNCVIVKNVHYAEEKEPEPDERVINTRFTSVGNSFILP